MSDHDPKGFAAPEAELNLPALEHDVLDYWGQHQITEKSLYPERFGQGDKPAFVFYDGPPFATGLPHYGHLLAGTIKDIVPRYFAMRGHRVERRFGWDCHGLPIESLVEDQLNVHGRAEIEALGVPEFNAACRASVLRYTAEWRKTVTRMGRWVDFDNDYKTMDPSFMESVWWVFKQLWDKGLIYEGHRVQPVSPALGTPLSNFEVAQGPQEKDPVTKKDGHRRRQDPSVTLRFALEDEQGASLWAWTTTPWTLPSNLALAVHPDVEYVKVRVVDSGELAYLEPGRLADYQARGRVGETEELARMKGSVLVGRPYRPLFPFFERYREPLDGKRQAFYVVAADYVTTDSGTGIVHQAPAFGEDDFQVGQKHGLPLVNPLSLNGIFDDSVGEFAGLFAKDADKSIVERLKADGRLVDQDVIVHPYPHCYRTDQPLIYMALSTWFMKVEDMRDALVENNAQIRWVPDFVGASRFGNWLAGARDWNLSRNRYFGTPLPIWRCDEDPSDMVCVGSRAELEKLAGLEPGSLDDMHRESIDPITFPSQKTPGGTMRRTSEVFDCWFESGSMPYAQNHYPFDASKIEYVEKNLPADFIAEGLDQTRGWFYTLHVLATAIFERPAFRNVIVNGMVLAADGKKMSKSLKNYPDPMKVVESFGADAMRAYIINSPAVRAEPMRFGKHKNDTTGEGVRDTVRLAILPLWNAYNFLTTYARADGWAPSPKSLSAHSDVELDRWILSRLQSLVLGMREEFDNYRLYNLVPAFLEMCEDLNNWYIRRGRRRYWRAKGESPEDKQKAYDTLYRVLVTTARCIAPILPFFSEALYLRLVVDVGLGEGENGRSLHLMPYPEVEPALRDEALERQVATVRQTVALGLALRERERIGVRRPLPSLTVASPDAEVRAAVEQHRADILGELNVKELRVAEDDSELVSLRAKANFKRLGKRLGKAMKAGAATIAGFDAAQIKALLEGGEAEVEGLAITAEDILVERDPLPGRVVESAATITVVLDTTVDEELKNEGLVRELINRVQSLRKQAQLAVSDRIELNVHCDGQLARALQDERLAALLTGETLASKLSTLAMGHAHSAEDAIDDERVQYSLQLAGG
ncbi:MAG: isoleucine--tRNA ligase [Myxococcales bacterium]|nr:isoleucine--tRNA ligase [Myxococcales bacterium]